LFTNFEDRQCTLQTLSLTTRERSKTQCN